MQLRSSSAISEHSAHAQFNSMLLTACSLGWPTWLAAHHMHGCSTLALALSVDDQQFVGVLVNELCHHGHFASFAA